MQQPKNNTNDDFFWWLIIFIVIMASSGSDAKPQAPPPKPAEVQARAIIARHDSASGRNRYKHRHTVAEIDAAQGLKTVVETWNTIPDRLLVRISIADGGTTELGYNGVVGWTTSPFTGPVLIEGEPLKQLAEQAQGRAQLDKPFKVLSARAPTVFEGKAVVPVAFEDEKGFSGTIFFDSRTGLLHAVLSRLSDPGSADSVTVMIFADYKRFDSELAATTTTIRVGQQSVATRTTHFDHAAIDTSRFSPPPEVLAQLKRPPSGVRP